MYYNLYTIPNCQFVSVHYFTCKQPQANLKYIKSNSMQLTMYYSSFGFFLSYRNELE